MPWWFYTLIGGAASGLCFAVLYATVFVMRRQKRKRYEQGQSGSAPLNVLGSPGESVMSISDVGPPPSTSRTILTKEKIGEKEKRQAVSKADATVAPSVPCAMPPVAPLRRRPITPPPSPRPGFFNWRSKSQENPGGNAVRQVVRSTSNRPTATGTTTPLTATVQTTTTGTAPILIRAPEPVAIDYHVLEPLELTDATVDWAGKTMYLNPLPFKEFWMLFHNFMNVSEKATISEDILFAVRDLVRFSEPLFMTLANRILEPVAVEESDRKKSKGKSHQKAGVPKRESRKSGGSRDNVESKSESTRSYSGSELATKPVKKQTLRVFTLQYEPVTIEVHFTGMVPEFMWKLFRCSQCEEVKKRFLATGSLNLEEPPTWSNLVCQIRQLQCNRHMWATYNFPTKQGIYESRGPFHVLVIKGDKIPPGPEPPCKRGCSFPVLGHRHDMTLLPKYAASHQ